MSKYTFVARINNMTLTLSEVYADNKADAIKACIERQSSWLPNLSESNLTLSSVSDTGYGRDNYTIGKPPWRS